MRVSVAIPLFNEEAVVPELLRRVMTVVDSIPGGPHELVVVDDGSMDGTPLILAAAIDMDARIRVIRLSRNFGHQAAISAALDHVRGDVVVVMDGDLQDQPEEIPRFLDAQAGVYDVVYAQRSSRTESFPLRAAYHLFYRIFASLSRVPVPLDAGDFALLTRRVVVAMQSAPERNRYLRGLRAWVGFRQIGIPVDRASRQRGTSKYSIFALLRLAVDGVFAFSTMPIRAAMVVGLLAIVLTTMFAVWAVYGRVVLGRSPAGFTSIILVVTFLAGVNLFFLGVVGEYVGRVYEETKQRPLYIVDSVIEHRD